MGIEELRGTLLLSMEVLRSESGRLRLVSRVLLPRAVIDDGPPQILLLAPLYKLLVLFVKLLFDDGPIGGFDVVIELLLMAAPGNGILLGLARFGVSGNFVSSLSC